MATPKTLSLAGLRPDQIRRLTRLLADMRAEKLVGYAVDIDQDYLWCRGDIVRVPEEAELFPNVEAAKKAIRTKVRDGANDGRVLTVLAVYRAGDDWRTGPCEASK
jgi:hypothetical protein